MNSLVSKDEAMKASMVYVGYIVLKRLEKSRDGRASLTEISTDLAKHGITKSRPMTIGLLFLHLAGAIEFRAPYVYRSST